MAIYRGKGGKTDVVPADGDQEFAGSIIAEKDIHAHGNISADGDISIGGDIHWEGTITGDGSGLENVPTPFLQADDCIYLNNQVITNDYTMPVGKNGMTAGDVTVNGELTVPDGSDWHIVGTEDGIISLETLGIPNHDLVTVTEEGHLTAFNVRSLSPFQGDGGSLTGIPTIVEIDSIKVDVATNATNIQINADAIQDNEDSINALPNDYYNKTEVDSLQKAQDDAIDVNAAEIAINAGNIATNTTDIATNATDITQNKTDIEELRDEVDIITNSIIYQGSLNATVVTAPTDAAVGDMYINEYNVDAPSTNYPVASGWEPVTEVKYDDRLIKVASGWDKIESAIGVTTYTSGEIDAFLDEKADKVDTYTKSETYTKTEVDDSQALQDTEIAKKANQETTYTKDEVNASQAAQDTKIDKNIADIAQNQADIAALPDIVDAYTKAEIDAQQSAQDAAIATKANTGVSYTKAEADTKLAGKENAGTSYTKAESNAQLAGKADNGVSYTKAEANNLNAAQDAKINANSAKVSNATHTGEVTGSTALTIAANVVNATKLNVSGNGVANQMLCSQGNGALKWMNQPAGGSASPILKHVRFVGSGTVTIRSQRGVSSVGDEGTGKYRVHFAGGMPNSVYSCAYGGSRIEASLTSDKSQQTFLHSPTAANIGVATYGASGAYTDHQHICVSIVN